MYEFLQYIPIDFIKNNASFDTYNNKLNKCYCFFHSSNFIICFKNI